MIISIQSLHHHMTENDLKYFFGVDNHLQGKKNGLILAKVVIKRFPIVVYFPEVS